ncbi:transglycosylase SLT domain-containing protein [Endozoicomonas sp. G2_1]|uniref:transglycosylase SLT domain-containing protein n=1 Tax=Endozoicomonas sp. G2_1 TaxID=2821091 RepID=UPI001ADCE5D4|nr:transglycosylase SLT domain-containing protein [Endozoicomonas sp. G2_1]MBO9491266.1 transglycosylase SLT domain-containing protein [Endozoicomonas sp. G2_1]
MLKQAVLMISAGLSLWASQGQAENIEQRKTYVEAEKHIWRSDSAKYQSLYRQLHYYPLQPYLDQQRLMHKLTLSKAAEIDAFLERYQGTPLDWPLRKKWLNYLAKRNRQALFLKFYQPTSDPKLRCQHALFQLNAGVSEQRVLPKVNQLWLVGKSQPKVCDPLFKRWQQAGYRTENMVWQRLALAADGGKHTLIPYLTSLLPENQQYLGRLFHKVRKDPSYIRKLSRFPKKSDREAQIVAYGLKRYIWRDQNRALKTYQQAVKQFAFTEQQLGKVKQRFALALASKKHPDAQSWLRDVPENMMTDHVIQWRIADSLLQQDWQAIERELLTFPEKTQQSLQWRYWYARALLERGQTQQAKQLLIALADERHYYGFLAAGHLDQGFNLKDQPLKVSLTEKNAVLQNLPLKRAFEFFHLGRYKQARSEWNYWNRKASERDRLVASKLAYELGWYDRAIFTLANVGYLNDVELRFPLAFDTAIKQQAGKQNINPAWAFAITRRESSFMSDANSSAGAKGLMQVLPATAKQVDRRITSKKLLNADDNIKIGTKYLKRLLDRHQGNPILATAAYNAGPHRVKQWLQNTPSLPADMWIETIPFKETRDYVKSVMAYQQIYQLKVGQTESLFAKIVAMKI